jgi:hypothetical protein
MLQWMQKKLTLFLKIAITTIVLLLAIFSFPRFAGAQSVADPNSNLQQGVQVISQPLGLPTTDIRLVIARIIRIALGLLGIIALILTLYAGFLWMTAGGNEEQIDSAKKVLTNAVIGLAIILSAYAIVSFVISKLIGATTDNAGDNTQNLDGPPLVQNFQGSGALGQIIKDHYPTRDQIDVPRNSKIVVSFRRPIKLDSFVDDTSGDGVFGNCKANVQNWYNDCDRLKSVSDNFINIKRADNGEKVFAAVILGSASTENGINGIYTIVVKPITEQNNPAGGYLGSATERVGYIVHLGSGILIDDPINNNPSAFRAAVLGTNYYEWKFSNSTALDITPPVVESVFPQINSVEAKNSVIQINFSEPVDPTGISGKFNVEGDYYYLDGQNILLKSGKSTIPQGNFVLTNGFRTLEFAPSKECGRNACGNKIFCLPVCDEQGANCSRDNYEILLRAATTINAQSFEALPFSGVVDLSDNALDGNKNGIPNAAPRGVAVFPNQKQPDNYFWNFTISDQIDASAPFIQTITPGIDAQNINRYQELSMVFNKRMRADSMYSILLQEQPTHPVPIWVVPFSIFNNDNSTFTRVNHGPFLDSVRQYYFPVINSSVEDLHFNCFYPGKGPRISVFPNTVVSPDCQETDPQNCCQVITEQNKSFCCNGAIGANTMDCLKNLRDTSL